jgi:hypothetical protein
VLDGSTTAGTSFDARIGLDTTVVVQASGKQRTDTGQQQLN